MTQCHARNIAAVTEGVRQNARNKDAGNDSRKPFRNAKRNLGHFESLCLVAACVALPRRLTHEIVDSVESFLPPGLVNESLLAGVLTESLPAGVLNESLPAGVLDGTLPAAVLNVSLPLGVPNERLTINGDWDASYCRQPLTLTMA